MKTVTETANELKKRGKRVQILYIVFVEVFVIALIVALFRKFIPAVAIVIANLIFYYAYLLKERKACSDAIVDATVTYGVCGPLSDVRCLGSGSLSAEEFDSFKMLPIHVTNKSLLSENGFEGKRGSLLLKGWEASLHYPVPGAKGKDMYRFISGTLLTAQRKNSAAGDWLILKKDYLNYLAEEEFVSQNKYFPASCSIGDLSENYSVYGKEEGAAFPDELARIARKAVKQAEKIAAVRFSADAAQVWIGGSFYTLRTRLRFLPDAEWYTNNLLAERDAVWTMFREWGAVK